MYHRTKDICAVFWKVDFQVSLEQRNLQFRSQCQGIQAPSRTTGLRLEMLAEQILQPYSHYNQIQA